MRVSLVAHWWRICLPVQETWVWSLIWEVPTWCRAIRPRCQNFWACMLQLLKPVHLRPVLHNKRRPRSERPAHRNSRVTPTHRNYRKPCKQQQRPSRTKINNFIKKKGIIWRRLWKSWFYHPEYRLSSTIFPHNSVGKESACNAGDPGSTPGSGRSPREGNGNPLQ